MVKLNQIMIFFNSRLPIKARSKILRETCEGLVLLGLLLKLILEVRIALHVCKGVKQLGHAFLSNQHIRQSMNALTLRLGLITLNLALLRVLVGRLWSISFTCCWKVLP